MALIAPRRYHIEFTQECAAIPVRITCLTYPKGYRCEGVTKRMLSLPRQEMRKWEEVPARKDTQYPKINKLVTEDLA